MLLNVGEILRPHGIRGELKVLPFTDSPHDFLPIKTILFNGKEYGIEKSRVQDAYIYFKLDGVDSREDATQIKGMIYVRKEDFPIKEGHFFIAELIGSRVFAGDELIGTLIDIYRTGRVDTYLVNTPTQNFTFPAIDGVILSIDINKKTVILDRSELDKVMVYEI